MNEERKILDIVGELLELNPADCLIQLESIRSRSEDDYKMIKEYLEYQDTDFLENPAILDFPSISLLKSDDFTPGQKLDNYEIRKKIGEGGNGKVYLAYNLDLQREEAIKFLSKIEQSDHHVINQLYKEARPISNLIHPNIIQVYTLHHQTEDHPAFIAMEYVEGTSLQEKIDRNLMGLEEILDITLQVSEGLSALHRDELIHRDIKPSNILVTDLGVAKIVDFGLARKFKFDGMETMNENSGIFGTPHYMSPEQIRNEKLDGRTDIWSLGICLREMLRGIDFNSDIKHELNQIVTRTLHQDKNERYSNVDELKNEILRIKKRLSLITRKAGFLDRTLHTSISLIPNPGFAKLRNLAVFFSILLFLALTFSFPWTKQLIQGSTKYVKNQESVNSYQNSLNEAKEHYRKGRYYYGKRNKESLLKAKEEFETAMKLDPDFSLAYVGMADYYVVEEEYLGTPSLQNIPKAENYIDTALQIDPNCGEAYATRGFIRAKQWKWNEAETFYLKSIDLNREYAVARQWYSWYLRNVGRYTESKEQILEARRLAEGDHDLLPIIWANVVIADMLEKKPLDAIKEGEELVRRYPDFWQGYSWLGRAYQKHDDKEQALKYLKKAVEISKRSHTILANYGYFLALNGKNSEAQAIIVELKTLYEQGKSTGQSIAKVYNGLHRKEETFYWLEKDLTAKSGDLTNITWHPAFETLHVDARFKSFVDKFNLPLEEGIT